MTPMGFNQLLSPLLLLQMVIVLMLSCTPTLTSQTFAIAKPGCQNRCGSVSIPFPFGTREGCYLNKEFFINCTNSSQNAPQPLLRKSTINVTNISLDGQLRLLQFVGSDCYDRKETSYRYKPWMSLGKPFTFNSTANKFTAVGCDTYAIVQGLKYGPSYRTSYTTGCISLCNSKNDVVEGSCSGIGCCQTDISSGTWNISVTLSSYYNHSYVWDFNNCSYAFVVDDNAFKFSADNLTNLSRDTSLPMVVDWVIDYVACDVAQKNTTSYACTENAQCDFPVNGMGYRCLCKVGYKGNPYLPVPGGCQDIDECEDPNLHRCSKNSACKNTLGNYTCPCLKGYHGDGREGGDGCTPDQNHNGKIRWYIIVSGAAIGTSILLFCCFYLYLELKRRKENRLKEEFFRKNGGLILRERLRKHGGDTNAARIFTLEELKKATDDFDESHIIGQGGFGTVYKGFLEDKSTTVAIKKSKGVDQRQVEQFINEVIVLSQINNRNVVKLLGCCLETEVPLLVYEFISNGNLYEHLHNHNRAAKLSWDIRMRIASEIAGVLSYLHSTASPPIVHRDIKSSNILLDQDYSAKVSDFGTSKLVASDKNQVATAVQGTFGYLDPEYMQIGLLTEKSDVYSFGVVLIELLTGENVLSQNRPEEKRVLANHFISSLKEGQLLQILDDNIVCNQSIELLNEIAVIAKRCLSVKGEDRPSMKDIARELEALKLRAEQYPVQVFDIGSTDTEQYPVQAFEIDSTDTDHRALLGMQVTNANVSGDPSCLLYSGSHIITDTMMLTTPGGR